MSGGMIPERDWTRVGQEFAEAQASGVQQKVLCVRCVKLGNVDPPAKVVIYNGMSCCGAHFQEMIDGMIP